MNQDEAFSRLSYTLFAYFVPRVQDDKTLGTFLVFEALEKALFFMIRDTTD